MRQYFQIFALVLALFISSASFARADGPSCMPVPSDKVEGGPIDHLPWGAEVPFPWRGIQGVWVAEIDGCANYFSFKVVHNYKDGERILQAEQIDPSNCSVIARGVGYGEDRVVTAVMAKLAPKHGTYELKVHVFKETDLQFGERVHKKGYMALSHNVTVLSVAPVGRPETVSTYKLYKVQAETENICQ